MIVCCVCDQEIMAGDPVRYVEAEPAHATCEARAMDEATDAYVTGATEYERAARVGEQFAWDRRNDPPTRW